MFPVFKLAFAWKYPEGALKVGFLSYFYYHIFGACFVMIMY